MKKMFLMTLLAFAAVSVSFGLEGREFETCVEDCKAESTNWCIQKKCRTMSNSQYYKQCENQCKVESDADDDLHNRCVNYCKIKPSKQ